MMNYKKNILIIGLCLFVSGYVYAENFADMISPASSIGLGDTFTANSIGPDSVWLNPAGLASSFVNQYSVGGGRWVDEVNLFLGSAVLPTSLGNFGVGVSWLGMSPEEYEDSNGLYTGEKLNFNNIFFSLGYGREVLNIPIGANFKFIQSSFAKDDKLLILADFGLMYNFGDLNTGVMLRNYSLSSYDPKDWGQARAGAAWQVLSFNAVKLKLLSDIYFSYEEDIGINTGLELELFKMVNLRAGYAPKGYNKLQFGSGFKFIVANWNIKIDYGINPAFNGLDMSHFAQITVNSRSKELTLKADSYLSKADGYMESANFDRAEYEIKKALETNPDDKKLQKRIKVIQDKKKRKQAEYHKSQAENYIKLKEFTKARKELEKAIKYSPQMKEAYLELGKIQYEQGDFRNALISFRKALTIDKNYEEAKKYTDLLDKKVEEQKPIWLKEDKFYSTKSLVFENFQEELIMAKLVSDHGEFTITKEGKERFGRWTFGKTDTEKVMETAIRLPNLSKFKGIMISLRSKTIKKIKVVLVEQLSGKANLWQVPLAGISGEWKKIKIPFHYLQLPGNPTANIDLGKITQIKFIVQKDKSGKIDFDDFEFFQ